MERYDSYQDSGIEWIGEIPKNWGVNRVGNVFTQRNETVSDKDFPALSVTKRGIVPQLDNVAKTSHNDNRKLVLKGDFVINSRSDRKGSSGTSDFDGSVSLINMILKPRGIHGKYSHYLFRSYEFIEEFFRFGKGIVWDLWSTRFSEMKGINIPIPPLHEQEQIVEYLDRKTALIDSLIEKTVRKIALLKEKRTSLINEVVTKGLNPDVEMKDSGVEWIGEIPRHWDMTRVGYLFNLLTGFPWPSNEFSDSSGVRLFRGINAKEGFSKWDGIQEFWPNEVTPDSSYWLMLNDLVIPMDGSKVGLNYARIVESDLPCLLHQRVCRIRSKSGNHLSFLEYFLGSGVFKNYVDLNKTSHFVPHISQKDIADFPLPLVDREEQNQIVAFLDEQTSIIDSNITKEEKRIELLKEYRQSLISEVVTGKVKVANTEYA